MTGLDKQRDHQDHVRPRGAEDLAIADGLNAGMKYRLQERARCRVFEYPVAHSRPIEGAGRRDISVAERSPDGIDRRAAWSGEGVGLGISVDQRGPAVLEQPGRRGLAAPDAARQADDEGHVPGYPRTFR